MLRPLLACVLLLLAEAVGAQSPCPERLLVSGYFSNNVHVYDACTGAFERLLDDADRIRGAQAVTLGPDGRLYVVSEENGRILRYDAGTLAFIDTFIATGVGFRPTGLAFGPDGHAYVGGYAADAVRRYDGSTGVFIDTPVAARAGGLDGPDCGMSFGPDGKLYVPGYDSHNVVRYDPTSGAVDTVVAARTGGLFHTRAVLFPPGGGGFLVVSEGSGDILRFDAGSGALLGTFASGLGAPAGGSFAADGRLYVGNNGGTALRIGTGGANEGAVFANGTGGLDGSTFAAVIPKPAESTGVDASQIGSQYWVVGVGAVSGRTIDFPDVVSATGATFGDAFRPGDVARKRWGRIVITFDSCTSGTLRWESSGADSAGFGDGGYPITVLVPTAATQACLTAGFANVQGADWMNGSWWGGEARNGEGLFIARSPEGLTALAFFTHRPAAE